MYIFLFIGGIDSSQTNGDNSVEACPKDALQIDIENSNEREPEQASGNAQIGSSEISKGNNIQSSSDRRDKIAEYLQDQRTKKMTPKISFEKQQLYFVKEDLDLKRKLIETSNTVDQAFLDNANKMAKTMENVGNAMTGCFDLMKTMFQAQMNPPHVYGRFPSPTINVPDMQQYGLNQYFPSNCFTTTTFPPSSESNTERE